MSALGLIFDPSVRFHGVFALPSLSAPGHASLIGAMDIKGALSMLSVLALVMTAVFDATGTIRAVARQAGQIDENDRIVNGGRALTADSLSSIFSACFGGAPAAAYIESSVGVAAGAKTGLAASVVGVLFLPPLAGLVPSYAIAPALVRRSADALLRQQAAHGRTVDTMSGLVCAVYIVLSANIVTGHHARVLHAGGGTRDRREYRKLNVGTVAIAAVLAVFYLGGWAI